MDRSRISERIAELADYSDPEKLKKTLNNYLTLKELSEIGYGIAHDICIDIETALQKSCLTEIELKCLTEREINRTKVEDIAKQINKSSFYVYTRLNKAFDKIYVTLNGGKVKNEQEEK